MSDRGTINVLLSVTCALCGDMEQILVPLGFNQPSLSYGIEYTKLMESMDDAGMANTNIGWMHIACAVDYLKSPKPIKWPESIIQPEGSEL